MTRSKHEWTYTEDRYLIAHADESTESLAEYFGTTVYLVQARRKKLGARKRTAKEIQAGHNQAFIQQHYQSMTVAQMARALGVANCTISGYAKLLGVCLMGSPSEAEKRREYIRTHYGHKSNEEIAKDLGMALGSVKSIASGLGLKQVLNQSIIDEWRNTRLKPSRIAERLNINETYVTNQIKKYKKDHGINFS